MIRESEYLPCHADEKFAVKRSVLINHEDKIRDIPGSMLMSVRGFFWLKTAIKGDCHGEKNIDGTDCGWLSDLP
jgi:hypothetical protein